MVVVRQGWEVNCGWMMGIRRREGIVHRWRCGIGWEGVCEWRIRGRSERIVQRWSWRRRKRGGGIRGRYLVTRMRIRGGIRGRWGMIGRGVGWKHWRVWKGG
jgi:hypothetical protein